VLDPLQKDNGVPPLLGPKLYEIARSCFEWGNLLADPKVLHGDDERFLFGPTDGTVPLFLKALQLRHFKLIE